MRERGPVRGEARCAGLSRSIRWADPVHSHLLKADMGDAVLATLALRDPPVGEQHNDEQVLKRPLVSSSRVLGKLPQRTIVLSDHVGEFIREHGRVAREQDPGGSTTAGSGAVRERRLRALPIELRDSSSTTSSSSASRARAAEGARRLLRAIAQISLRA